MKILYCDIQLGASGDMLVGALIDVGLPVEVITTQLQSLPIKGFEIAPEKIVRHGISGIQAGIKAKVDTTHRNLEAIDAIISSTTCSDFVKNNAIKIFDALATAEAAVHGIPKEKVHFHEVGAIDSIVDILSFCIGIEYLQIDVLYYSAFACGTGTISTQHGTIPLPAPATVKLTEGKQVIFTGKVGELTTPTAAAILTTLGKQQLQFGGMISATGIGFGTRDYGFPSYTRVMLLDDTDSQHQLLCVLECTIDDMNPEIYPYVYDLLFSEGALDVYMQQVIMKKGRPGVVLSVLCPFSAVKQCTQIIFSQTTTLGVREYTVSRHFLPRDIATITLYGEQIRIKQSYRYNELSPKPEYEDCKKVAAKIKKPLYLIMEEALKEYYKQKKL
ncbi:MAG: nickel pincer cofactor biosynthesis protein LarC [Spirochaetes bacterium]|nr:nickel pincer cofactor biosynthesis protein LarC [Spirochaetota bacterium]